MATATQANRSAVPGTTAGLLRITVRASVGHFNKEIDISLPAHSSWNEVVGEVLTLINAPIISKPWRATTAAGRSIDQSVPLSSTSLVDGSLILLHPLNQPPAPVIRDATEVLAAEKSQTLSAHIPTAWSLVGCIAALCVASTLVGWPWALSGTTVLIFTINLFARHTTLLTAAWIATGALAAGMSVGALGWGLLAGGIVMMVLMVLAHLTRQGCALLSGTLGALASCLLLAGAGAFLPGLPGAGAPSWVAVPHLTAAASVIACLLPMIAIAPAVTTRAAGLTVPQLPTAGEDLNVAALDLSNVETPARRAQELYHGALLGCSLAALPAFGVLAFAPHHHWWVVILCLVMALGCLLHAARHSGRIAAWSLMALAMESCLGVCGSAAREGSWPAVLLAGVLGVVMATACLWVPRLRSIEPTTLVWIERLEAVCITAIAPVALYLAGVFTWIRGLG